MKYTYTALPAILLFACTLLRAQHLHVDKNVYFPGDTIRGVAYLSNNKLAGHTFIASLEENDEVIKRALVFMDDMATPFSFIIPDGLKQGSYAFKFIDFQSSTLTHYKDVILVNEDTEILSTSISKLATANAIDLTPELTKISENEASIRIPIDFFNPENVNNISLSITDSYQDILNPEITDLSCQLTNNYLYASKKINSWRRGYELYGEIKNSQTKNSEIRDKTILLSVFYGSKLDLLYTRTDSLGQFSFLNLIYHDDVEAYASVIDLDSTQTLKFHSQEMNSNYQALDCKTDSLIMDLSEMARLKRVKNRVKRNYSETLEKKEIWELEEPQPLFPYRDELINQKEYVSFESMEKMIKESIPYVYLRKGNIRVFSPSQRKGLKKLPLLFIDGLKVSNEEFLSFDPNDVFYVEILNEINKLSNYGYHALGGIVSIISKNGIDKSLYGTKVTLPKYTPYFEFKDYKKTSLVPYFPRILFWNPSVQINPTEEFFEVFLELPDYDTELIYTMNIQFKNGLIYQINEKLQNGLN